MPLILNISNETKHFSCIKILGFSFPTFLLKMERQLESGEKHI